MRGCLTALALLIPGFLPMGTAAAQERPPLRGVIRSWGSEEMAPLLAAWEKGFVQDHPEILFLDNLKGSETAHAALYTEVADLALMNRETYLVERYGMWVRKHHYPLELTVATGSATNSKRTFALAIFVNQDNPIRSLTLKQLDGIFGAERTGGWDPVKFSWHKEAARGPEADIRTWGRLGLAGEWAERSIVPYGYPLTTYASEINEQGAMLFFRTQVMEGADKWNFDIQEYTDGREIVRRVGKDPRGIGYTALEFQTPDVRAVPISPADGAAPVPLTEQTVASRAYPLTRSVYICIDRTPGRPVEPKVAAFLNYILSAEGQRQVTQGGYLPLSPEMMAREKKKLE